MLPPLAPELITRIEADLAKVVTSQKLPGLAVGIIRDQELAWFGGYGLTDQESGRQPDPDTLFRIASITKTFTTAAILQLRDAGRLQLDDPLSRHLPEFADAIAKAGTIEGVTLRRLLTHRSGLTTEAPLPCWDALDFPTHEALRAVLSQLEVVIPQDSAFKYSNLAFGLLGEVIARVTGGSYDDYLKSAILDPLGMSSSVLDLTEPLQSRLAVGYLPQRYDDALMPARYAHLNGVGACGQLQSSVADLTRWVALQFRTGDRPAGGAQILSGTTLEEFHRPQYLEPDWSLGYCLGWRAYRIGDRIFHGHGGGIWGFTSQLLFCKATRTGVICLANVWPNAGLLNVATGLLTQLAEADAAATPPVATRTPTPAVFGRLLGTYMARPGIPSQITYHGGQLRLEASPMSEYLLHAPAILEPTVNPSQFLVRGGRGAGETAVFEIDPDGQPRQFSLGGFVYRKLQEPA